MDFLLSHLPNLSELGFVGYWVIFLISLSESLAFIGLISPGSILIVLAGALAAHHIYDVRLVILFSIAGAILGDTISFELGKKGKFLLKKMPLLKGPAAKGTKYFRAHGGKSVFLGRFIGPLRPVIPFVAGMAEMARSRFYVANVLSGIGWGIVYVGIGYVFGEAGKAASFWMTRTGIILCVFALAGLGTVWMWEWMLRQGQAALAVIRSLGRWLVAGVLGIPVIARWRAKHPRTIQFLRSRFAETSFLGLPFTTLVFCLLVTIVLLSNVLGHSALAVKMELIDIRISNLLYTFRTGPFLTLSYAVTLLVEPPVFIAAAATLTLLLLWQRRKAFLIAFWIGLAANQATVWASKFLVDRPRPGGLIPAIALPFSPAFPSAHSATAVMLYGFLAYLVIRTQDSWRRQAGAFFVAGMLIVGIGVSRVYLGVHFASDVLAGWLVGLVTLFFSITVAEWLLRAHPSSAKPRRLPAQIFLPVSGVQALCICMIMLFTPLPWTANSGKLPSHIIAFPDVPALFLEGQLRVSTETLFGSPREPVNVGILARQGCIPEAFRRAHWAVADRSNVATLWRLFTMFLLRGDYRTAPFAPSFYDAQPQDYGFQKELSAESPRERERARFWQTPYATASGQLLYVGTASLLRGSIVRRVAPEIDVIRDDLVSDLRGTGLVTAVDSVKIPFVLPMNEEDREEALRVITDGKIVLLEFNDCRRGPPGDEKN